MSAAALLVGGLVLYFAWGVYLAQSYWRASDYHASRGTVNRERAAVAAFMCVAGPVVFAVVVVREWASRKVAP
jgi:hypothetical protein